MLAEYSNEEDNGYRGEQAKSHSLVHSVGRMVLKAYAFLSEKVTLVVELVLSLLSEVVLGVATLLYHGGVCCS